jgi:hypothetical protein
MRFAILTLLLSALTLGAADVTGTWTGTLKAVRDDGSENTDSAHLVLKQEGSTVTGQAGGSPDDQHEITGGKVEGEEFTFKIVRGDREMRIALQVSADGKTMKGQIQRERNGVTQTAQLELTRK